MKNPLLALPFVALTGIAFLNGCGGGGSGAPLPAVSFLVTAPAEDPAGNTIEVTVTALDKAGNTVSTYSGAVHFSSSDSNAILPHDSTLTNGRGTFAATLETPGNQTITATDTTAPLQGVTGSIRVTGFIATGAMSTARERHTATLLSDGRVLVVGGMRLDPPPGRGLGPALVVLSSAELYDVTAATFAPTGGLSAVRTFHTATLLPDGRVLVAGGDDRVGSPYATAELYDPNTGQFAATGAMVSGRSGHAATLLPSGKVLITGGANETGDLATAELYDPDTGTVSSIGSMTLPRLFHTATLLDDGRVLIAGGGSGGDTERASAELYDPITGTFSATGSMTAPRAVHQATLLEDGSVLITGGSDLPTAEIFDPATGRFTATDSMASARSNHTATRRADGSVLVAGGDGPGTLASGDRFDPGSGQFSATGSMTTPRAEHSAVLLLNGAVLVTGGLNSNGTTAKSLASAELFYQ